MPYSHPLLIDNLAESSVGFHKTDDDKRLRYAFVWPTGVARGTVVIAPGRREFIEKRYEEVGKDFLARGFRVILFEWRGQGLSDRLLDGFKRQRDHMPDFSAHMRDFTSFYERVVRPNQVGPLLLCGHSMGAHLLLRWLIENAAVEVAGAILTAPMLALAGGLAQGSAHLFSWGALKLGYGDDYAAAQHDYNAQDRAFTGNPLTHDPVRFSMVEKYFKAIPDLVVGGVTWEWVNAAVKSMEITQRRHHLASMTVPVLAMTGDQDQVTPISETQRYLSMLPNGESVVIANALHDVMGEVPACRAEAWGHMDRFLAQIV